MPVSFLTSAQQESYGRYAAPPSPDELTRFFHLSEDDQALTLSRRGDHNRLGFALQLTTVRFLGTFLENSMTVPSEIVQTLSRQLGITKSEAIDEYRQGRWRRQHAAEIRERFGYRDFSDPAAGFRLARWLCALCWTGTERPSVLFDRAMAWLLTHKVLLPGLSVLERFIARLRGRMENRLWRSLGRGTTAEQRARLEGLLTVPEGSRASGLERLRLSPISVSGPALVRALERLQDVRGLEIRLPATVHVAPTRLASLARFAGAAKVTSIIRLAPARRLATLVAFVYCLEATAQDEALEVLEMLLHDLFGHATQAYTKARLRTLKDLDQAAIVLVKACRPLLDPALPDGKLRAKVFAKIPRAELAQALEAVETLVRPPDDVYYRELTGRYRGVRRFLPAVLKYLRFETNPAGEPVVEAFKWLGANEPLTKPANDAPREVITKAWRYHVLGEGGTMDYRAYTFCVLDPRRRR